MSLVSKTDNNSSIRIPDEIIEKAGLKAGSVIIWLYDENTKQIVLMVKPENFAKALRGLGKDMWKDVDVKEHIQEERNSW